jgi:hypothetical protein
MGFWTDWIFKKKKGKKKKTPEEEATDAYTSETGRNMATGMYMSLSHIRWYM